MAFSMYTIQSLLDKMNSVDKDYRFMATNDLISALQHEYFKLDDESEKKVVSTVMRLLEDKNGEVQNLAVKCLGLLVTKVKENYVEQIANSLCDGMKSTSEQLRDISSIGLKTVIADIASQTQLAVLLCKLIVSRLLSVIPRAQDPSVQLEALDILSDILKKYGGLLADHHSNVQDCLIAQMTSSRLAVRKRATIALGQLVICNSNSLFVELMRYIIGELNQNRSLSTTRTYVQCIATISRQAGHRIGNYVDTLMPLLFSFSMQQDDDEFRDYCLQALESLVLRCPKEVTPYVMRIVQICLEYLKYDPNYNYDSDDEDMEDESDADDDDDDDEGDYSDDDDVSWKVRRAASRCINAVIRSRPELLYDFYRNVSPTLISRFKEREENVKSDIFSAYVTLLRQTRTLATVETRTDAMDEDGNVTTNQSSRLVKDDKSPNSMLQGQIPSIVKALRKILKDKSVKTRQGCFSVLSEVCQVLYGALNDHMTSVMPGIVYSLSDKSSTSNMKIDTLLFLQCVLTHHEANVFYPHIDVLVPLVIDKVSDMFYKVISEALFVLQHLIKIMRPLDGNKQSLARYDVHARNIYKSTVARLETTDIDQEVKERAITCMGHLISNMGDILPSELKSCLPILVSRLRNDSTRLCTVKALTTMANSPLNLDLTMILPESIQLLSSFLRKNSRALKLSSLTALNILIQKFGRLMNDQLCDNVFCEIPSLINESDLHVSQLTSELISTLIQINPNSFMKHRDIILKEVLVLLKSPLLQGGALNALLGFICQAIRNKIPKMNPNEVLQMLTHPIYYPESQGQGSLAIHKQAFYSVAKCVAGIIMESSDLSTTVVQQLIRDLESASSSVSVKMFTLLALGEIGRVVNMSAFQNLKSVITSAFSSSSEEIKSAASFALGNIAAGNLAEYLPFIFKEIESESKKQYLLLHSLKEASAKIYIFTDIIVCQSSHSAAVQSLAPYVSTIWNLLFQSCEKAGGEGIRNMVAECLGKLTILDPENLLPDLHNHLASNSSFVRCTVVNAVKFAISEQHHQVDLKLKQYMGDFLKSLEDTDPNVRRVALVTLNSAAHNKPSLIKDMLDVILPSLYDKTIIRKDMIREVEMGPFKHTVDDGLDIRKAAFECMYTLLDTCLDKLDIFQFLNYVEEGLKDHYDIKMLTYLMLIRLATLCPNAVLQRFDKILDPLRATVMVQVKALAVKQEFEKQNELKRSALRALTSLMKIPDSDKSLQLNEFLQQINSNPAISSMFETIKNDESGSGTFIHTDFK
ncbi:Cullin-associated NEDD8-dissociated protein 1 [Trichoplax sp. H2]|nr:Cullin-associated NEDD8-dissociated protein 1 [Trichoplax sp. H2]|eukprot:RDD39311.1 Cullin-associated NEDD8-dissociated protein 1 [Trichoplax sp. H2]